MIVWSERPADIANLLNPAFCGRLVHIAVRSYQEEAEQEMPLALCALVLPLVLHKATRDGLPRDVRTTLLMWIEQNQDTLVEFPSRVRRVLPFTREAILFSTAHGALQPRGEGFRTVSNISPNQPDGQSDEVKHCISRSRFVGKWLAQAGDTATIYQSFGMRP